MYFCTVKMWTFLTWILLHRNKIKSHQNLAANGLLARLSFFLCFLRVWQKRLKMFFFVRLVRKRLFFSKKKKVFSVWNKKFWDEKGLFSKIFCSRVFEVRRFRAGKIRVICGGCWWCCGGQTRRGSRSCDRCCDSAERYCRPLVIENFKLNV